MMTTPNSGRGCWRDLGIPGETVGSGQTAGQVADGLPRALPAASPGSLPELNENSLVIVSKSVQIDPVRFAPPGDR
jgi:hypothetical protein